ncbi:hypothetical protein SAMN04487944_104102 [Gracilibacillus ureilyticus]|uniref:Uncharacterized protein n=1 Tax=Gracilibacillus ureilyticus TaxID=531814 RepID=A0A1H9P4W2_9BACI|nr:hypothetical protein [Gracilibacillus ureilyticus]SER43286.1 hypothetical protein SAMN04487944_104102 [Gracilibacillus ureilyticus]
MYYNKIRIPLLIIIVTMMILDLSGVIYVPPIVIFIIAFALLAYNIYIRKNAANHHRKKD